MFPDQNWLEQTHYLNITYKLRLLRWGHWHFTLLCSYHFVLEPKVRSHLSVRRFILPLVCLTGQVSESHSNPIILQVTRAVTTRGNTECTRGAHACRHSPLFTRPSLPQTRLQRPYPITKPVKLKIDYPIPSITRYYYIFSNTNRSIL